MVKVSVGQCTDGIIQVSEKTRTINPRQMEIFVFEISASVNMELDHNCTGNQLLRWCPKQLNIVISVTVFLADQDANVLDMKMVSFTTIEGCIYCPAGQCDCDVGFPSFY